MSDVLGSMMVICACSGLNRLMIACPNAASVVVFPHSWRPNTSMFGTVRAGKATGCKALSPIANGMFSGSAASAVAANAAMTWLSSIRSGSRANLSTLPAPVSVGDERADLARRHPFTGGRRELRHPDEQLVAFAG